jgi:hypothetical protein
MDKHPCSVVENANASLRDQLAGRPIEDGIRLMYAADLESGFVKDDLRDLDYYQVPSGDDRPWFLLQFNARRASRPGQDAARAGCVLCADSVRHREQRFVAFRIAARAMVALSNPWPFMPIHVTLACAQHVPQSWSAPAAEERRIRLTELVCDVAALARAMPGFFVIYNGDSAGASIPHHRHYQAFTLPAGHGPLPVETASVSASPTQWQGLSTVAGPSRFPLRVFVARCVAEGSARSVASLLAQWDGIEGDAASANLIASVVPGGDVTMYVVPRHRLFRRAVGFAGVLGSLEVCGVFVVSSDAERRAIDDGRVTHQRLWRALEAVQPPQVDQLLG